MAMVEEVEREKWGSPYAITEKGREFVAVLIESIEKVAMLTLQAAIGSGKPRKIIFPTSTPEKYNLVSFDGRRVTLETADPAELAFQTVRRFYPRPPEMLKRVSREPTIDLRPK
jgi:hypothetical protein